MPHKCKSRFCPKCCLGLGLKLKERLIPVLATFKRVMMLTLTVDPQHFAGPQEAFEHVKAFRCLSVTMQALRRAGCLASDRWFCVIEWHQNGWPHWHVLVDAERISFDTLTAAWNVNLVKLGKRVGDLRTGFGCVRFSQTSLCDGRHAGHYAAKYLLKAPRHGFPAWVLSSETRKVHRYSTSRGFWADAAEAGGAPGEGPAADAIGPESQDDIDVDDDVATLPRRTIAEQLATCGQATDVLREIEYVNEATGEVGRRYEFISTIDKPLGDVIAESCCGVLSDNGTRAVMPNDLAWMWVGSKLWVDMS